MAFNDQGQFPPGIYASPARSGSSRRFLIFAGLLLVMALICFLLLQADLAFPGLYFWFIGGDLMQFWLIVLVVLGFIYWRALPRARAFQPTLSVRFPRAAAR